MSQQLVPLPPEGARLPVQPACDPDRVGISRKSLRRAAKHLGMKSVVADSLGAHMEFGKAIGAAGAIKIGRTMLFSSGHHSQDCINHCDGVIDRTQDDEVKLKALEVKALFIREITDAGVHLIKSAEVDESDGATKTHAVKPPQPGQIVGPMVIANQAVVNTSSQ